MLKQINMKNRINFHKFKKIEFDNQKIDKYSLNEEKFHVAII